MHAEQTTEANESTAVPFGCDVHRKEDMTIPTRRITMALALKCDNMMGCAASAKVLRRSGEGVSGVRWVVRRGDEALLRRQHTAKASRSQSKAIRE